MDGNRFATERVPRVRLDEMGWTLCTLEVEVPATEPIEEGRRQGKKVPEALPLRFRHFKLDRHRRCSLRPYSRRLAAICVYSHG